MLEKLLQELKDGNYTHALRFLNLLIMLLSREADIIDPIAARDEKSEEYSTKIKYAQQDDDIFWGYVFANVNKEIHFDLPAPMGVTYKDNTFQLYFNPAFINKDWTVMNLLEIVKHEGYHILYNHMELFKDLEFQQAVNYATDCEINQYLPNLPKEGIRLDDIKKLTKNKNLKEKAGSLYYYEELKKVLDNLPKDKQCTCGAKEHNERVQKQQQEQQQQEQSSNGQNSENNKQSSENQQQSSDEKQQSTNGQSSDNEQEQGSNEQSSENKQEQDSNGQDSENNEQSSENEQQQSSNEQGSGDEQKQGSNGQGSENNEQSSKKQQSNGQSSSEQQEQGSDKETSKEQNQSPENGNQKPQNKQNQNAKNPQNRQNEQLQPRKCTCGCNKKNNKFDTHEMWKNIYDPENNNFIPVSKATQNLMNEVVRQMDLGSKGRGSLPKNIIDQINKLNEPPQIKWQSLIVKQIGKQVCGKRKSPNRLNRRDPKSIYKKGNLNDRLHPIVVAFDVSGSVSNKELMYFLNELQALSDKMKLPITYIQFDWDIQNVETIAPGMSPSFNLHGRGGTSFQPVFDYLKDEQYPKETQLFIFTDGGGERKINNRGYKKYQWIISGNQHLSVQNESRPIIRLNIKDFEY
jgi:predicted metal-dependent peptidase